MPGVTERRTHEASLQIRALQGAGLAFIWTLLLFTSGGTATDGGWTGLKWWILPTLLMPVGGAVGGLVFHATGSLRRVGGWRRTVANVLSVLTFIVAVLAALVAGGNGPN